MRTSVAGRRAIQAFEGFRSTPYRDAGGKLSIGFGHLIKPAESFSRISYGEAEDLLSQDLRSAENAVNWLVTAPLTQNQFDALVSLVFNIGSGNFAKSTLLKFLNAGDYAQAAGQFARWSLVDGRRLSGLVKRREAETQLFITQAKAP